MAVKFQYNKTSLNEIGKQLKVRQKALPTLQNKESALRLEVRKAKNESDRLIADLEAAMERYDYLASLWNEFDPGLVAITDVDLHTVKVAGVKTPALGDIHYEIRPFNAFAKPAWYADGVAILKELSRLGIESEVYREKARILDYQRKKTTQKVNLYEVPREGPHPGLPAEEDDPEGEPVRESPDSRLPGSDPQDQAVHGG